MKKLISYLLTMTLLVSASSCRTTSGTTDPAANAVAQKAQKPAKKHKLFGSHKSTVDNKHEFRGVWIQTAWQDRYMNKTPEKCMAYLNTLVETLSQTGINAIIFQVRPEGDAFYQSQYEPWSRFLTGTQGKAPAAAWDPMAYMIQLCHNHGMEFHAWLNPYRMYSSKNFKLAGNHLYYQHPEYFVVYDDKLYLNPALPESRSWIRTIIKDIVSRYDVDAIHMDDYFYPYPAQGKEFDDLAAFQTYGPQWGFNTQSRADWGNFRRRCVDVLIKSVNEDVKALKPWVRFGVSPFGIYRNQKSWAGGSATNGTQCYDDLYADVLRWANSGWIDYVLPQVYWEVGHKLADYEVLCDWWADNITSDCHLFMGQSIERSLDANKDLRTSHDHFDKKLKQAASRKKVGGNSFWYGYQIEDNQYGVRDYLQQVAFEHPTLPVAYTELNDKAPGKVQNLDAEIVRTTNGRALHLTWKAPVSEPNDGVRFYNIYRFTKGQVVNTHTMKHIYRQVSANELYDYDINESSKYTYVVTAVDYYNNEGKSVKKSFKLKL